MKYFLKKLLGHEIFRSMVFWALKTFFEKFLKSYPPLPPTYLLYTSLVFFLQTKKGVVSSKLPNFCYFP